MRMDAETFLKRMQIEPQLGTRRSALGIRVAKRPRMVAFGQALVASLASFSCSIQMRLIWMFECCCLCSERR